MSTATAAGILRAISEIIRSNNPTVTQAESARIIKKNYLDRERLKYKDPESGQLLEGEYCYRINGETVKNQEVLPLNDLESILLTSACGEILLPGRKGLYYEGMGIYFKYEGKTYESVKANQAVLEQALKSGSVEWYFNGNQFRKEGGKGSVTLTVGSTDTDAKVFLQTTVTKPVITE